MGFLLFTPIWTAATASVMVTGIAETWGDYELMALGVSLAVLCVVFALWYSRRYIAEATAPSVANKREASPARGANLSKLAGRTDDCVWGLYAGVVAFSFALNYFQTPFFYDVLHMRYGFNATWRIERTPIFLYFMTVPYFATYMSGGLMLYRWLSTSPNSPFRFLPTVAIYFVVATLLAFLETLTNANPFVRRLFCYEDTYHALTFGSVCYGISFVLALPCWLHVGGVPEDDSNKHSRGVVAAHAVIVYTIVAVLDAAILELVKEYIAPSFTTVTVGAGPLGECLKN